MSLQDKLDAFKADFKAGKPLYHVPPEIHPIMERATAEPIASGQAGRAVKAGDRAPQFRPQGQDGNEVSSDELRARGLLVLTFYRDVWCPYYNLGPQANNEVLPQIQSLGANVVAVSSQIAVNSRRSVRDNELDFPVLSDAINETAAAFGLRFNLPDYLVDLYKMHNNDLPGSSGDPSLTLPIPARYDAIGQDEVALYSEINPDYVSSRCFRAMSDP
ncbi:redoxin domain-containing protein [Cupriavidus sp. 8B]